MKKPNLFIIGAPKCGTTSLAKWLAEHPEIHMSSVKEPHFLNTDQNYNFVKTQKSYDALFAGTTERIVGEASVYYAYSQEALRKIGYDFTESKVIFCIRNPIDLITSLFLQQRFANYEDVDDFSEMWRRHDERLAANRLPPNCPDPVHIDYKRTCRLGDALETIWSVIPRERTHVVSLDQLSLEPSRAYREICDFLGVDQTFGPDFTHENRAKVKRNAILFDFLRNIQALKGRMGITGGLGLHRWLNRFLVRPAEQVILDNEVHSDLNAYFRPQIEKLEDMLGWNLSAWKDSH